MKALSAAIPSPMAKSPSVKNGMDASTSYAALLADAVAINGMVNAGNATVGGGNFTFDNSTGAMTSAGKSATVLQMISPVYSIDISSPGGIKSQQYQYGR